MKVSSSALYCGLNLDENEGTDERTAMGHWKCLEHEETFKYFFVFKHGRLNKQKVSSLFSHETVEQTKRNLF